MERTPVSCIAWLLVGCSVLLAPDAESAVTSDVTVAPGASIQAAIDAAAPGAVIRLSEGVYPERIAIEKPITIVGAGWEKTIVGPEGAKRAPREKDAPARRSYRDGERPPRFVPLEPTITVRNTHDVLIQGLRVRGPDSLVEDGAVSEETLVLVGDGASKVKMIECAVIGPSMNGISIRGADEVYLGRTLVAALWGTGIQVSNSKEPSGVARVQIFRCEVRNCYHRCITIASDEVLVASSRISGSAWHGIRYDGCSPRIDDNLISGNARSGIYASGDTKARVHGNVFWKNEMDGVSCWYTDTDTIEENTFVGNLREGIAILGAARPTVLRNVFAENAVAVWANKIADGREMALPTAGELAIDANFFWKNPVDLKIANQVLPTPPKNESTDPGFADGSAPQLVLRPDGSARRAGAGASEPMLLVDSFPIQPEETAMIPDTDTREFKYWKR
jgi:parallel beta-helix repeat protein